MSLPILPANAGDIFLEWTTSEGGFGVTAFTDREALPYVGLYPLNRAGKPCGMPIRLRRCRIMGEVVVGFEDDRPLAVFVDIEVSARGLSLIICVPFKTPNPMPRSLFAPWGGPPPSFGRHDAASAWEASIIPFPFGRSP